jgi:hypothetical protein
MTGRMAVDLPKDYTDLALIANKQIRTLTKDYPRTAKMYELLMKSDQLNAHWNLSNYTTVNKLGYNDHGPIHAQVTAAYAMQMMTLLVNANVHFDVIESGAGDSLDDSFLVTLAGIMLHDIGNALHRTNHEAMGVILAERILSNIMPDFYSDEEQCTLITDFILSAVQCHDMNPAPLFVEGAVVAVSDGCDMTKGRARTPFDLGKIDIHAVSALSIEAVNIKPGQDIPVEIEVIMSNSAGIFQVEQTLVSKLIKTSLAKYVTVTATVSDGFDAYDQPGTDKRIIHSVKLKDGRLQVLNGK